MRYFIMIAGLVLLLVGLLSMATPIPGSSLIIATGAGLIICASKRAERFIRGRRQRHRKLNNGIVWLEERMGERLSAPMRRTRPATKSAEQKKT